MKKLFCNLALWRRLRLPGLFLPVSLLFLATAAPCLFAAEKAPAELASALQERLAAMESLRFTFLQTSFTSGRQRQGSGQALFYRPAPGAGGLRGSPVIRWDYSTPDQQVIINDGKTLSLYSAKDRQMIVTPAGELDEDITYGLLTGQRTLEQDFEAAAPSPRFQFDTANGMQALRLIPRREQGQVKEIHVLVDPDLLIRRLIVEDYFDSITELVFEQMELDALGTKSAAEIAALFHFTPPPGTEIIEQ